MKYKGLTINLLLFAGGLALSACMGDIETGDAADPDSIKEAIWNGDDNDPLSLAAQIDVGLFDTNGNHFCSGTLVRNDVVLTAGHCFQDAATGDCSGNSDGIPGCPSPDYGPEEVGVLQHYTNTLFYGNSGRYQQASNADVAIFGVGSGFMINGSTLNHSTQLFGGGGTEIDHRITDHRGWGYNDCDTSGNQTGGGVLRHEFRTEVRGSRQGPARNYIYFTKTTSTTPHNTLSLSGDSGSSYRDTTDPRFWNQSIVGVMSFGSKQSGAACPYKASATDVDIFRYWAKNHIALWDEGYTTDLGPQFNSRFPTIVDLGYGTPNWVPGTSTGVTQYNSVRTGTIAVDTATGVHGNAVILTEASSSNDDDWQGLVGHYRDPQNFYVFEVREQTDTARLRRFKQYDVETLASADLSDMGVSNFRWRDVHELILAFIDTMVFGLVDGVAVVQVDDGAEAITAGFPGLWNEQQRNAKYHTFAFQPVYW